jgi:hypothetical protein
VTLFRSLGYQHRADHLGGRGDVEQQGLLGCRGHHAGGDVRKFFSSSSVRSASSVHWNLSDFFRSLKKGRPFSPSLLIKRPRATIISVSFMTSFDKVKWPFLQQALRMKGFSPLWCQWIHQFVSGGSVVVKVNNDVGRYFQTKKGL